MGSTLPSQLCVMAQRKLKTLKLSFCNRLMPTVNVSFQTCQSNAEGALITITLNIHNWTTLDIFIEYLQLNINFIAGIDSILPDTSSDMLYYRIV